MPYQSYNLHLKGRVGGPEFDADKVDRTLASLDRKSVSVLIDSTGGSLAAGMSICAAFRRHGNVSVHFTGLNASAATIASLGAKEISIDRGAAYLVHQCSLSFMRLTSMNADQFRELIEQCRKNADDLDKLDSCIAQMYAGRCKKKPEDLYELMKRGGWLSPQEALEWGFVDRVTDFAEDVAASVDETLAAALADAGIPVPVISERKVSSTEVISGPAEVEAHDHSAFRRLIDAAARFFSPDSRSGNKAGEHNAENPGQDEINDDKSTQSTKMDKNYDSLCPLIGAEHISFDDSKATLEESAVDKIDAELAALKTKADAAEQKVKDLQKKLDEAMAVKPADKTSKVDENSRGSGNVEKSPVDDYMEACREADRIFNMLG